MDSEIDKPPVFDIQPAFVSSNGISSKPNVTSKLFTEDNPPKTNPASTLIYNLAHYLASNKGVDIKRAAEILNSLEEEATFDLPANITAENLPQTARTIITKKPDLEKILTTETLNIIATALPKEGISKKSVINAIQETYGTLWNPNRASNGYLNSDEFKAVSAELKTIMRNNFGDKFAAMIDSTSHSPINLPSQTAPENLAVEK